MADADERRSVVIALHDPEVNGAGLAICRCARLAAEHGWRLAFWVPGLGRSAEMAREITDDVWVRGRPIRYSLRGLREPPGLLRRLQATPRYLRDFAAFLGDKKPDVLHANTYYCLPEASVARACGTPAVLHAHEILAGRPKDRAILRWSSWAATHVVAVSEACAAPLRERGLQAQISVVPNGVAPSGATPPHKTGGGPVVGTVGVISRRKGTDLFLDMAELVAARRPEVRFVVLGGDGPGEDAQFAAEMHRRASAMRPAINIDIRQSGRVADELASWSAFVLPARQDPFPLAVLEAMAAGLPSVACRVGGISEQLDDSTGLLVPPEDPGALADAVLSLLADEDWRAALGRGASARVASTFTLEGQASAIADVWDSVARPSHAAVEPAAGG